MDIKKKILFILPNLNGGGAEKALINIMKYNYSPDQYEIKLLLVDKIGVYFDLVPQYVEIISLDIKRVRSALIPIIKKINTLNPDIVFTTLNRMNILVLSASYFFKNKSLEVIVREPNLPSAQIKNKTLKWWQVFLIKMLYKKAHKVIAQTDEMKDELHKYFNIPLQKIETIINPIDKENIDKSLINISNPFDSRYKNLLAIGRLSYQKGFDILVEAMKGVVEEDDNFRLYILGEGEERKNLESLIKKYNLEEYVFLFGFKKNPYQYIKFADALVLSSRWEGLPNVVLESLYIGTFVITTKVVKLLDDLIVEGENGFLAPTGNTDELCKSIKKLK